MQKKLLIMGCSLGTEKALEYARNTGVYTVITDYNSPEKSPLKNKADEYWMIDVFDQNALEQKCRQEGISGVFAATSEYCLDQTKELCKRLNLPFYASDEGWACARDKVRFKKQCKECGLSVPRLYNINSSDDLKKKIPINFPVIVKPADSCAQQGLSVCRNRAELEEGIKTASAFSETNQILIEDYIEGSELAIEYCFINGKAIPIEISEMIYIPVNGKNNFVFAMINGPRQKKYLEELTPKISNLFARMGCSNGIAFIQAIHKDNLFYFLELGYRIPASGNWKMTCQLSGIHPIEFLVDYALGRKGKEYSGLNPHDKVAGAYMIWSRPGKIMQIEGEAKIKAMQETDIVLKRFREGDSVPENSSMAQMAYNIALMGNDIDDLRQKVRKINSLLHLRDEKGEDMLFYLSDDTLLK